MKTKNMKYSRIIITCLIVMLSISTMYAETFTKTRKVNKTYKINSATSVEVSNKYGKVVITESTNDSLYLNIDMTIQSDNEEKVTKMASVIEFDFTETSHFIVAKTVIGKKKIGIVEQIVSLTDMFEIPENYIEINFEVIAPKGTRLVIDNKYGDVFIGDHSGKLDLSVSNGDLKAYDLSGLANIDVKFGNAIINSVEDANIELAYSDLDLKKATKLSIDSKSSKVFIEKVNTLRLMSKRDKVIIREVNVLNGNPYFTDLTISELTGNSALTVKYGNIIFESISEEFTSLTLTSKYTNIGFIFDDGAGYDLSLILRNLEFTYPPNAGTMSPKIMDEVTKQFETHGKLGSKPHHAKVTVVAEYGKFNISHK